MTSPPDTVAVDYALDDGTGGESADAHPHVHFKEKIIRESNTYPSSPYSKMEDGKEGLASQSSVLQIDGSPSNNDKDEYSISPSMVSSVLTADGIHDPTGFGIVCLVILIGSTSRGIMFPTLWPLVESLGGSTVTLGYAVAAHAFGRILLSPVFGSWSVKYGYTITLTLSVVILLAGTVLYAQSQNVGSTQWLLFAQFILGVGSATIGVVRAFVAEITATRNRTTYLAWLTALQYAGSSVTPFIGAIFAKIFEEEGSGIGSGFFALDQYTCPAYFMSILCIITLILLRTSFQDRHRPAAPVAKKKSRRQSQRDDFGNTPAIFGLTTTYEACLACCILINVAAKGSISAFETLGITYAESHFDMYSARAGAIVATCGTIGLISLLSMGHLAKFLTDVQMIWGGASVMALGVFSLIFLKDEVDNPSWRYFFAMFMIYAIGYPIGHTAIVGLFSKIVGRRPQGVLMGWFASAGSAARVLFPIISGYVVRYLEIEVVFYIIIAVLGASIWYALSFSDALGRLSV